jgi:hypothetical protein
VFDRVISATLTSLLGAFSAALMIRIAKPVLDVMQAGQFGSAESGSAPKVIGYLAVATESWIRVVLLSALMVLLAGAIAESKVRA